MSAADFAIVSTTVGTRAEAETLASMLVERRLAACVQIMPVSSVYRWQGDIERSDEFALQAKIARSAFGEVRAAIEAGHSYDLPEVVLTAILDGSAAYLGWLDAETCRR